MSYECMDKSNNQIKMGKVESWCCCSSQGEGEGEEEEEEAEVSSIEWEWIEMSEQEEDMINRMHKLVGDKWGLIAGRVPGRTAEEIERYWIMSTNTKTKDKLYPPPPQLAAVHQTLQTYNNNNNR